MSSRCGPEGDPYFAPSAGSRGEIRERGSRFVGVVVPVAGEEEASKALDRLRDEHRDATHVCWAWRLGQPARERSADAGEPAGTAGMPILQVLRGAELSDVLLAVVRWFGGTKLGKGGLMRAYAAAARATLEGVGRVERVASVVCELSLSYASLGAVKRVLEAPGCRLEEEAYSDVARLVVAIELPELERFEEAIGNLGPGVSLSRGSDC